MDLEQFDLDQNNTDFLQQLQCKSISGRYDSLALIGQGNYGQVHLARERFGQKGLVAVKIPQIEGVFKQDDGIHVTIIREILLLQYIQHDNVIHLKEVCVEEGYLYLIFPFMPHNLEGYLQKRQKPLTLPEVKCLFLGCLRGLKALHSYNIIHRDIKTSNLLLSAEGVVKIADFGLAKKLRSPEGGRTANLCTLWFRPPELLLGSDSYSVAVDMWSAGCILARLLIGKNMFNGLSEPEMLDQIFSLIGEPQLTPTSTTPDTINSNIGDAANGANGDGKGAHSTNHGQHLSDCEKQRYWPGVKDLKYGDMLKFGIHTESHFEAYIQSHFQLHIEQHAHTTSALRNHGNVTGLQDDTQDTDIPYSAIQLLGQLLTLNPKTRITAEQALKHPFFDEAPYPCYPSELHYIKSSHDLVVNHMRKKEEKMGVGVGMRIKK